MGRPLPFDAMGTVTPRPSPPGPGAALQPLGLEPSCWEPTRDSNRSHCPPDGRVAQQNAEAATGGGRRHPACPGGRSRRAATRTAPLRGQGGLLRPGSGLSNPLVAKCPPPAPSRTPAATRRPYPTHSSPGPHWWAGPEVGAGGGPQAAPPPTPDVMGAPGPSLESMPGGQPRPPSPHTSAHWGRVGLGGGPC